MKKVIFLYKSIVMCMSTKTISIIYLAMQTPALKSEVQMLWNYFNYKREFKELSAQRLYTMYMLYSDV